MQENSYSCDHKGWPKLSKRIWFHSLVEDFSNTPPTLSCKTSLQRIPAPRADQVFLCWPRATISHLLRFMKRVGCFGTGLSIFSPCKNCILLAKSNTKLMDWFQAIDFLGNSWLSKKKTKKEREEKNLDRFEIDGRPHLWLMPVQRTLAMLMCCCKMLQGVLWPYGCK